VLRRDDSGIVTALFAADSDRTRQVVTALRGVFARSRRVPGRRAGARHQGRTKRVPPDGPSPMIAGNQRAGCVTSGLRR
jgi:hypothetical protein